MFSYFKLETDLVLVGLCRSRGLKGKERIEKKDGRDVEHIPNWPFGLVLNSQSRATVAEAEADAIELGLREIARPKRQRMAERGKSCSCFCLEARAKEAPEVAFMAGMVFPDFR